MPSPGRRLPRRTPKPVGRAPGAGGSGLWIYGHHPAEAAAANPSRRCLRLLAMPERAGALAAAAARSRVERPEIEVVERRFLDSLVGDSAVHQGLVVLVEPLPAIELADVLVGTPRLVVLDQVTDPRNVGAVLRASAAFGAGGVVVQSRHAPPETGVLAKAASGALETVPLVRVVNIARALRDMQIEGVRTVGLDIAAERPLPQADVGGAVALVLGSEGAGLRRLVRETCGELVRIPICAGTGVDSLNVATAAAVALYACVAGISGRVSGGSGAEPGPRGSAAGP